MSKKCTFMGNTDATPSTEILNKAQTIVVDLIEKHNVTTFYCDGYGTFNFMMAQYINELKKYILILNQFILQPILISILYPI